LLFLSIGLNQLCIVLHFMQPVEYLLIDLVLLIIFVIQQVITEAALVLELILIHI